MEANPKAARVERGFLGCLGKEEQEDPALQPYRVSGFLVEQRLANQSAGLLEQELSSVLRCERGVSRRVHIPLLVHVEISDFLQYLAIWHSGQGPSFE